MDILSIILISVAIALMLAEFALPGGFSFSLGISFLIVVLLRHFGITNDFFQLLLTWAVSTLIFTIISTTLAQKIFGGGKTVKKFDEDKEAKGAVVSVIEDIHDNSDTGRILFQGTSWKAKSKKGIIKKGSSAIILSRNNICYIVKPGKIK